MPGMRIRVQGLSSFSSVSIEVFLIVLIVSMRGAIHAFGSVSFVKVQWSSQHSVYHVTEAELLLLFRLLDLFCHGWFCSSEPTSSIERCT